MRISKYHGTGNDFVMIEDMQDALGPVLRPEVVSFLCDRHFGVGADGLIRIAPPAPGSGADFFMDYRNADGSAAEMCGNGVRCLAKLVFDRGLTERTELAVDTRAGLKRVWIRAGDDGRADSVTVDMGAPAFEVGRIPMSVDEPDGTFLHKPFEVDGRQLPVSAVSMGNPHCVVFWDGGSLETVDLPRVGGALERDPRFPEGTNVELVVPREGGVDVRVWERGVGETMACGTGACAALVASALAGVVDRRAEVRFPGGTLVVDWRDDDRVMMTGPAVEVFDAEVRLEGTPRTGVSPAPTMGGVR